MKAEIKDIHSPDMDWTSGALHTSLDEKCFSILLQVFIGPVGGEGAESFDLIVCSPDYLRRAVFEMGIVDGAYHLIVNSIDKERIESYLRKRVASVEGDSWERLVEELRRLGRWEYDNYED
ncbi:Imm8 family immunity protein [Nonomuraea sp. NPDC003214]